MASKQKSGKSQKVGRQKRRPSGQTQFLRTYNNKVNRVNRERAKSGKDPLVVLGGYNPATGVPNSHADKKPAFAPLNPRVGKWVR